MQKLVYPGIRQSNYRTGAPQASGMFHWGFRSTKKVENHCVTVLKARIFELRAPLIVDLCEPGTYPCKTSKWPLLTRKLQILQNHRKHQFFLSRCWSLYAADVHLLRIPNGNLLAILEMNLTEFMVADPLYASKEIKHLFIKTA